MNNDYRTRSSREKGYVRDQTDWADYERDWITDASEERQRKRELNEYSNKVRKKMQAKGIAKFPKKSHKKY